MVSPAFTIILAFPNRYGHAQQTEIAKERLGSDLSELQP